MKMKQLKWVLGLGLILGTLGVARSFEPKAKQSFHSPEEIKNFMALSTDLPIDTNNFFATSGVCAGCHGFDPAGLAMVDSNGHDINIADDWRATMMANSAKDPLWRAKVSHEGLVNPSHKQGLESVCTSCHAPAGRYTAHFNNQPHYSMAELLLDTIGLDGINCGGCHQILPPDSLGLDFSGQIDYTSDKTVYGPYKNPFADPMSSFIGFTVEYSEHINNSEICASCHSLITQTVDLQGNYTGDYFVEQATYHEWLNSNYNINEVECQTCHVPRIDDNIIIAANYAFLAPRRPFGLHHLVGGNAFMLKLLQDNIVPLGITATSEQFDSTIARTERMLREHTLDIALDPVSRTLDTAIYRVRLQNLAGHKFPSGYPARRAYIQFIVQNEQMDTLFASGLLNSNYELIGIDPAYEPHHTIISNPNQVQIYEQVMGDVNDNVTTVLERAKTALKDNRIPPEGFSIFHPSYDSVRISGLAALDVNFNYQNGIEGSGSDDVYYHIPMGGYFGALNISVFVYYQPVPPRFLTEMFSYSSASIDTFRNMYQLADKSPSLVAAAFDGPSVHQVEFEESRLDVKLYPNPNRDGRLFFKGSQNRFRRIAIYTVEGTVVQEYRDYTWDSFLSLPFSPGLYLIYLENVDGGVGVKRVIRR